MKIKRLLMALLLFTAAFLLVSCGKKDSSEPTGEGNTPEPETQQPGTEVPSQPAHEHSAAATWTYDENGHWHACSGCDDKLDQAAHTYAEEVTKQPQVGVEGEKTFTCDCGHSYTEKIDALVHTHEAGSEWKYSETEHWHECACEEKVDQAAHVFSEELTTAPQCGVAGEKTFTCDCGYSYTEAVEALVHAPAEEWTYDETNHWHACPNCDVAEKVAHEYSEELTTAPQCGVAGEKTFTCECGHSYTEPVEALVHAPAEEWTYDEKDHWHVCPNCEVVEKAAHAYEEQEFAAADGKLGYVLYTCECGHSYSEYNEALGKLYFVPGPWNKGEERYAVYYWADGKGDGWVSLTDADGDGVYEAKVDPAAAQNIIFVRMNGATTANNWDNKWDQTNDLKLPTDGTNLYTINAWGDDTQWKGVGVWTTAKVEHEHKLVWANDETHHWQECEGCVYATEKSEHKHEEAFGNGYKWTECECGSKTEQVVALTYTGTFSGYVDADPETGLYVLPKLKFACWNRIEFAYNGVVISSDNATFEGLFNVNTASATWTEVLYSENKTMWLCSLGSGAEYLFSYDAENNTVKAVLGGVQWGGTWTEIGEKNAEGLYTITKTFGQWNRVTVTYDGKLLKLDDLTVTGALASGATSEPKLYHEDGLFLYAGQTKVTFVITFNPETMELHIEEQKLPENQMAVVAGQDVGDNKVAVWEAGKVIRDENGKWFGNGWRLVVIVDAEGKIAYMVQMPANGYGNPKEGSYYSHSSLREENPAWALIDGGYTVTVPEGGFALTTYGNAIGSLLNMLGATETSDAKLNKAGSLDDNIRISYDATTTLITVTRVEAE